MNSNLTAIIFQLSSVYCLSILQLRDQLKEDRLVIFILMTSLNYIAINKLTSFVAPTNCLFDQATYSHYFFIPIKWINRVTLFVASTNIVPYFLSCFYFLALSSILILFQTPPNNLFFSQKFQPSQLLPSSRILLCIYKKVKWLHYSQNIENQIYKFWYFRIY